MDNDGDIDIMIGNSGSNYTYLNNGAGTFLSGDRWEFGSTLTGTDTQDSYAIAIGDVNGYGWPDAVVGNKN